MGKEERGGERDGGGGLRKDIVRQKEEESEKATSQKTVLAAECRVTYVQGLNDFESKRACHCQNKEGRKEYVARRETNYCWNLKKIE